MKVIIHCSDSTFGNAATITRWHVLPKPNGRGWSNIGYHSVILNGWLASNVFNKNYDGYIETGRPLDDDNVLEWFEYGAHTLGENDRSIATCLIGKSGEFTPNQLDVLELIQLPQWKDQFGSLEIGQHSDYDKKKPYCAGLSKEYIQQLNRRFR